MPRYIDPSWKNPTSPYQVQMYEVADPHVYISSAKSGGYNIQYVYHLVNDFTLLSFNDTNQVHIVTSPELEKYVKREGDKNTKLTSKLLLLRVPQETQESQVTKSTFNAFQLAEKLQKDLQSKWVEENPDWKENEEAKPEFEILELYEPTDEFAFALAPSGLFQENWIDRNFEIIDQTPKQTYHKDAGVIYVNNPREYKITYFKRSNEEGWRYDPNGEKIKNLEELTSDKLGFKSRKELIQLGEHIYAVEGCWYCHTDQTRTLIQDLVSNGSESFPAPPSSPNEYIYQKITFPGTKRNGPDLSRVAIKRPNRDWHKGHFWAPKTASQGSIMPAFQHFFDFDPRGTSGASIGVPNYKFEAIFQYLMTKGTRITPPNEAWWLGKDPLDTLAIIEGKKVLK